MEGSVLRCSAQQGEIFDERDEDLGSMSSFSGAGSDDDSSVDSGDVPADHEGHPHLYDMSSLMTQLPLRRGLSRFYDGKSQSFRSLGSVKAAEDLPELDTRSSRKKQIANVHISAFSMASRKVRTQRTMRPSRSPPSGVSLMMCSSVLAAGASAKRIGRRAHRAAIRG